MQTHIAFCLFVTSLVSMLAGAGLYAQEPSRLRLKDNSFSVGHVVPSPLENHLAWQGEGFGEPFQFQINAIRALSPVDADSLETPTKDGHLFELAGGGMLTGELLELNNQSVSVRSSILGDVRIRRDHLLSIVDATYAGKVLYSGPANDATWTSTGAETDWQFEGGALVSQKSGGTLIGQVGLTAKTRIAMTLTWKTGSPDFVVALGTDRSATEARAEDVDSAARLEVWDREFALVRETDGNADIEILEKMRPASNRLDIVFYIDQIAGVVIACDQHGRPLERLEVPADTYALRTAVHLSNVGPTLQLEKFEVREWDGLTTQSSNAEGAVLTSDRMLTAFVTGYDHASQELILSSPQGDQRIPLKTLRRGELAHIEPQAAVKPGSKLQDIAPEVVQPAQPGEGPAKAAGEVTAKDVAASEESSKIDAKREPATSNDIFSATEPAQPEQEAQPADVEVEILLVDGSRLSGRWLAAEDNALRFQANGLEEIISFPAPKLLRLIGSDDRFQVAATGRAGQLKFADTQLTGALAAPTAPGDQSHLFWQPVGSENSVEISASVSGAIIYRKPLPKVEATGAHVPRANQQVVRMFINPQASVNSKNTRSSSTTQSVPEIAFRTGDVIAAEITEIDESGIKFKSKQSTTTAAPHGQVQSVTLNPASSGSETSPEKLERLMTVPRSMKLDPPTHLFIATNGDYLRGRLVRMHGDSVTIEVRLELVEIPKAQVARIIWLHDRLWDEAKPEEQDDPAAEPPEPENLFQLHAIRDGDRGLTFAPKTHTELEISGTSELLGDCSVEIEKLNQLLFGHDIEARVRDYRDDPWTLALAQYPRVFLDDGSPETATQGGDSEFVGKAAPGFGLQTLDGERFRLQDHHDRILVLDFWASWCGPCVQTMPQVEEVVAEIGTDRVHLVAVNIQEAESRVAAAVKRLGIKATVLLDVDGEVAAAYKAQAIPQTVIIDRDGNVTHLFVGGGARFIAGFREALESLTVD